MLTFSPFSSEITDKPVNNKTENEFLLDMVSAIDFGLPGIQN